MERFPACDLVMHERWHHKDDESFKWRANGNLRKKLKSHKLLNIIEHLNITQTFTSNFLKSRFLPLQSLLILQISTLLGFQQAHSYSSYSWLDQVSLDKAYLRIISFFEIYIFQQFHTNIEKTLRICKVLYASPLSVSVGLRCVCVDIGLFTQDHMVISSLIVQLNFFCINSMHPLDTNVHVKFH